MHPDRALVRRAKKLSFNAELWRTEDHDRMSAAAPSRRRQRLDDRASSRTTSRRRSITVDGRDYGYLRLWSFDLADDDGFVAEVIELLGELPQDGLIIDLRGNPGGLIWAAERLLQLFTPSPISPSRFSIIASDLTRAMTDAPQNRRELGPWRRTLLDAIGTGEVYSQSVTITPYERCNDIGQVYGGPVVAVVDPTTYSAADLFAAGFADNGTRHRRQRRPCDRRRRRQRVAGRHAQQRAGRHAAPACPGCPRASGSRCRFVAPPGSAPPTAPRSRMSASSGTATYAMTRDDLLHGNSGLHAYCARLLEAEPSTSMTVEWTAPRPLGRGRHGSIASTSTSMTGLTRRSTSTMAARSSSPTSASRSASRATREPTSNRCA